MTVFAAAPEHTVTRPAPRTVETSCGEFEHERLSRRANVLEGVVVYALFQGALWSGAGLPAQPGDMSWLRAAGPILAGLAACYAVIAAPWLHADDWHSLGVSRPFELLAIWPRQGWMFRLAAAVLILALPAALATAGWNAILIRLGIRLTWPDVYRHLTAPPWSAAGAAAATGVAALVLAGFLVRWTNLATAARDLALPLGLVVAGVLVVAAASAATCSDWSRFREFTWIGHGNGSFLPRLAGYVPWGILQQWLLLAYFNTRLRKSVPKSGWFGVPGRAVTAGLTGVAFGALHSPNLPLAIATCVVGCVFGWLFQQDRCRHLVLLGLAHALAGALAATLTSIRMGVGPQL